MTYDSKTTLNRIRQAKPCADGWTDLLAHLGKTQADDEPLDLLTVLDSRGFFDDALWVASHAMPDDRLARHFQAWCAEQVLHLYEVEHPNDNRIRDQIAMLRNDEASSQERAAARDAAWSAAWSADRDSAMAAAKTAALASADDASWEAAWAETWDGEWYGDWDEDWDAARDEVWDAHEAQLRRMLGAQQ